MNYDSVNTITCEIEQRSNDDVMEFQSFPFLYTNRRSFDFNAFKHRTQIGIQ